MTDYPVGPKTSHLSWKRAVGLSALSIYTPFLAMAVYVLLFVSCAHCKGAAWAVLPIAPGMIFAVLLRNLLQNNSEFFFIPDLLISISIVLGQAWLLKRAWGRAKMRYIIMACALLVFSFIAVGLLALIRA